MDEAHLFYYDNSVCRHCPLTLRSSVRRAAPHHTGLSGGGVEQTTNQTNKRVNARFYAMQGRAGGAPYPAQRLGGAHSIS